MLIEIIEQRIAYHNDFFNENLKITSETMDKASIKTDMLVKYSLSDNIKKLANYNVNSFTQVGLEDPFPEDDRHITGSLDDVDPAVYYMP